MRDFSIVAAEFIAKRNERRALAEEHLRIGIAHARANRECVILEEELLNDFPFQKFTAEDGTILRTGTRLSSLRDRVRVVDPPENKEVASTHD